MGALRASIARRSSVNAIPSSEVKAPKLVYVFDGAMWRFPKIDFRGAFNYIVPEIEFRLSPSVISATPALT